MNEADGHLSAFDKMTYERRKEWKKHCACRPFLQSWGCAGWLKNKAFLRFFDKLSESFPPRGNRSLRKEIDKPGFSPTYTPARLALPDQ